MKTILCSAMGLGFYNPGLIVNYQLKQQRIPTEVLVFENYITPDKRENIIENRKAFHQNFAIAKKASTIPRDIRESFDHNKINNLLDHWVREDRRDFIVFSGYWMFIIEMYKSRMQPKHLQVDLVYVDSDYSPSWKSYRKFYTCDDPDYHEIWLFNSHEEKLMYEIPITSKEALPYDLRSDRFVIHGGGWGMGTYQKRINDLEERGISLDVIINDYDEAREKKEQNRYFMNDPKWSPWMKNEKHEHEFPPFSQLTTSGNPHFSNKEEYHMLFDVIRNSKGIISKPGGATLIDSLASATPVILLDAFGKHEQKNGELWQKMGFGITYEKWEASQFSMEVLDKLHQNLMEKRNTYKNYIKCLTRF